MSIFTALEGVPLQKQKPAGGTGDDADGGGFRGSTANISGVANANVANAGTGGHAFRTPGFASPGMKTTPKAGQFGSRAGTCLLMTITVICIGVLVLCGVMVVREYTASKDYRGVSCRLVNITYLRRDVPCMFCASNEKGKKEKGAGACTRSSFPCVSVDVAYVLEGARYEGQLHTDSLQAMGSQSQCSFNVCLKRPEDSTAAVKKYADEWWARSGTDFECFYDTTNTHRVIETKKHTKSEVIHCMLWPSVIIVLCGALFLRIELRRRGLMTCKPKKSSDDESTTYTEVSSAEKGQGKCADRKKGPSEAHARLIENSGPRYTTSDEVKPSSRRKEAPKSGVMTAANGAERGNRHRHQTQPQGHNPVKKSLSGSDVKIEKTGKHLPLPLSKKNSSTGSGGQKAQKEQKGVETPV